MLALVEHLERSGRSAHLFGWTSHLDLLISQTPPSYPLTGPHLHISPQANGTLEFRYIDSRRSTDQWHRTVPGASGNRQLDNFFEQLRWFGGESQQ
jgi:hypothetical protein